MKAFHTSSQLHGKHPIAQKKPAPNNHTSLPIIALAFSRARFPSTRPPNPPTHVLPTNITNAGRPAALSAATSWLTC